MQFNICIFLAGQSAFFIPGLANSPCPRFPLKRDTNNTKPNTISSLTAGTSSTMTQLPETAYAPFSEPWVLADVEQQDKQQLEEQPACEVHSLSKTQTKEGQPTCEPVSPKKSVQDDQLEAIIAALGPEVQKYWTQTKGVVFGPEVQKYWMRIRGAVFPFVGGITAGVLTAGLTVYKIK
ncbi:hypothetical protein HBI05_093850 [Parastagonospora nodorum]|nr:hypothetical protein HBI05_093850 [Parastagonospora nodorum]